MVNQGHYKLICTSAHLIYNVKIIVLHNHNNPAVWNILVGHIADEIVVTCRLRNMFVYMGSK